MARERRWLVRADHKRTHAIAPQLLDIGSHAWRDDGNAADCASYERPLLSYHMNFGTAAMHIIDAFMANLDCEVIDARYRASKA